MPLLVKDLVHGCEGPTRVPQAHAGIASQPTHPLQAPLWAA